MDTTDVKVDWVVNWMNIQPPLQNGFFGGSCGCEGSKYNRN